MGQSGSTVFDQQQQQSPPEKKRPPSLFTSGPLNVEKAEINRKYAEMLEKYVFSLSNILPSERIQLYNTLHSSLSDIIDESYKKGQEQGLCNALSAVEQIHISTNIKEGKRLRGEKK